MFLRSLLPAAGALLAVLPFCVREATAEPMPRVTGPVVHEGVAVYFLRGASAPGPVPLTLQEGLAKGTVEVRETGNVQELKIENKGREAVFVQFGDIVKGGQQDRVLTVSMMLGPNSGQVPIGSYCVEQGRWAARGVEDVKRFASSDALMPSREAKIAMAKPREVAPPSVSLGLREIARRELQRDGQPRQRTVDRPQALDGQGEVWRNVEVMQQQLTAALAAPVASETSRTSLQLALEAKALKTAQEGYLAAIEAKGSEGDDIVGVVVAVYGRISSADIYPSNGLFRKMWPKLARAATTEALAAKRKVEAAARPIAPPVSDVEAFLKAAQDSEASQRQLGPHGRLETRSSTSVLQVEARTAEGALVHKSYIAR